MPELREHVFRWAWDRSCEPCSKPAVCFTSRRYCRAKSALLPITLSEWQLVICGFGKERAMQRWGRGACAKWSLLHVREQPRMQRGGVGSGTASRASARKESRTRKCSVGCICMTSWNWSGLLLLIWSWMKLFYIWRCTKVAEMLLQWAACGGCASFFGCWPSSWCLVVAFICRHWYTRIFEDVLCSKNFQRVWFPEIQTYFSLARCFMRSAVCFGVGQLVWGHME